MNSDLTMNFHLAQEFTKNGYPHIHCIIHSYFPDECAYCVIYTCSGNIKKVSEDTLLKHYSLSQEDQKHDAIQLLCSTTGAGGYKDEDGDIVSPEQEKH
jgi:hypothetical protein